MRKTLLIAIYFVSVLVFFCVRTGSGQTQYPKSSIRSIDSELITSKSLRGKIVMLHFWFIACAPCLNEIPDLSRLHAKYANNPKAKFIAISLNDSPSQIKQVLKYKKFPFLHIAKISNASSPVFNSSNDWPAFYKVDRYPTSIIFNKLGQVAVREEAIPEGSFYYYDRIIQSLL